MQRRQFVATLGFALGAVPLLSACAPQPFGGAAMSAAGRSTTADLSGDALQIANERGLSQDDIRAALMTYTPSGTPDQYYMFASGGHAGQVLVIGLPSMRILKEIAVFTPEPWQGYGSGSKESAAILAGGNINGKSLHWGDTHHPALSETNGEYDGQWLFINDKANGRLAVIDLRDFATKQIVKNPLILNDHGGSFVTPNTEYIIEGCQYATPFGWEYAPLSDYSDKYPRFAYGQGGFARH